MTYDDFQRICEREHANGFGDVCEIHLGESAWREMYDSMGIMKRFVSHPEDVATITNPVTGTNARLVVHYNHVVVQRAPQPAATTHIVRV